MKPYPKDFLWGASMSSYQVEGGLHTQWSEWEQAHAKRLAQESPKKLAWLPHSETLTGQWDQPENYVSGAGVEHFTRYKEDIALAAKLNMNSLRFGIEWARLEPEEGVWDLAAIEHYRDYINELKQHAIEPIPTLWHWTMPVWFTNKGGFEQGRNLHYFEQFVQKVADEYATDLNYVLTLNEPNVYAAFGYITGEWPPQHKNPFLGFAVYRNLVRAHKKAYRILKQKNPKLQIGFAHQLGDVRALQPQNLLNRAVVSSQSYAWNWWFINRVRRHIDFIGMNYYFTEYRDWRGRIRNPQHPISDLGWYMEPSGISALMQTTWRRYKLPILITENGLADASDINRKWWLDETVEALQSALESGVDLRGYLHWSLLDNFEWAYGWWPKFGLVAVDRTSMKRTPRSSAQQYAALIRKSRHG